MQHYFISCVWHLKKSPHWESSDGQSVWLQIGENDIITLSDMVNTGWGWPSDCPWPHTHKTHKNMHTHTHREKHDSRRFYSNILTIHSCFHHLEAADLLFSPNLSLCVCVCYSFHTNHSLLSVVQSNTFQRPLGLSLVSAALWATLLTNGKGSDKVTVPKMRKRNLFYEKQQYQ